MHEYRICTYKENTSHDDPDTYRDFYPEGRRFFMPCIVYLDPKDGKPFKHEPISFHRRYEWERDMRVEIERVYESLDYDILDIDNNYEEFKPNN